ncbi:MAG TPA: ATP-binding protein [Bryobacteraceae bacterium]|nr:ATP-binding protein [Bryobacteraceae bacterium]
MNTKTSTSVASDLDARVQLPNQTIHQLEPEATGAAKIQAFCQADAVVFDRQSHRPNRVERGRHSNYSGRPVRECVLQSELFFEICRILGEEGQFQMAWAGNVDIDTGVVTPVASYPRSEEYLVGLHITIHDAPAGVGPVGTAIRDNRHVLVNDLLTDARMHPWQERAQRRGYRSVGAFPIMVHCHRHGAIAIYAREKDFFDPENVALLEELAANVSFALERMYTERMHRRAVQELDQFFALSLDLLCICSLEGRAFRLNSAWEKTLGFNAAELASHPWVEFVHPEDRPRAEAAWQKLKLGQQIEQLEFRVLSKSGSYRWLIGSATPSLALGVAFAAVRDITERKSLEEQLKNQNLALEEQNRRLNEASRLKTEFLANMSHELRSPLNGILGFTELLYDGKLGPIPERPREYVGRVHSSAMHLLELINGVLDLSKVEVGHLEFFPERVSVTDIIEEVMGILGSIAAGKKIQMQTEIDETVDNVLTDPGRLKQILHNYLSNALKFTNPEGRVVVRLKREGSSEFRLEISDTGIGIAQKDLARLFVEFQQLDATKAKLYPGTGLGLALTKRIVEGQGGRVGVESEVGKGSTFFAVLPRGPEVRKSDGPIARVLVVEDGRATSLLLSRVLEGADYQVETAGTGREAVEKCRRADFDAITLDLVLSDGSGLKALREIRSLPHFRSTPVIVISALDQRDVAVTDMVQAFLTKPINPNQLFETLEQVGVPARLTVGAK